MNLLGIRVEPKQTTFVVIEYNEKEDKFILINDELIKVPAALDFPEKLKYIRTCVLDILREYDVSYAGIRVAESNSQNLNVTRIHIEGVIQESFASSMVENYFIGVKSSIGSRLNIKSADIKKVIEGNLSYNLSGWEKLTNNISREAALVAVGTIL